MQTVESEQFLSYRDLAEGMTRAQTYVITPAVYEGFLRLFGDRSPLHVDPEYAKTCGFEDTLMHGAILNGFISNFVGMVFPGGKTLELSVDIRFLQPTYLNDAIRIEGKIAQLLEMHQVAVLHMKFVHEASRTMIATARVQVKMMAISPPPDWREPGTEAPSR